MLLGGLIKFNTGQYAQAEASINQFLAAVPDHVPARRTLAAIQLRSNNPLSAIEVLKPLVADHPDDLIARQMLAGAYLRQGDMDSATAMFQGTRQLAQPGDGDAGAGDTEPAPGGGWAGRAT